MLSDILDLNKSSAVAEMGDRGHNRHGPKIGGGLLCPFRGSWNLVYYNVAWAEVYTSVPSGVFIDPAIWPQ